MCGRSGDERCKAVRRAHPAGGSEHSAIFQCVQAANGNPIDKILLTASGGPFFGKKIEEMRGMTREQALAHPNWSMGAKITIDSATMMNKGLELIEAMCCMICRPEDIEIVVHRESMCTRRWSLRTER